MKKPKQLAPRWVANLRSLMQARGLNPRSLSLKAGLNATAVRDMLEGRTRFPRYDTVLSLSRALETTPSRLMGAGDAETPENHGRNASMDDDLELLTEIIARLQEVIGEYKVSVEPRDFALMASALYRRMKKTDKGKPVSAALQPKICDLLEYEMLRQKNARRR